MQRKIHNIQIKMDCGISFGFNKWALASGLGLLSLGSYETYQIAVRPVETARHFSIEPMEFKVPEEVSPVSIPDLEPIDTPEETIDIQPEIEEIAEEASVAETVIKVEEATESETPSNLEPVEQEETIEVKTEIKIVSEPIEPTIPSKPETTQKPQFKCIKLRSHNWGHGRLAQWKSSISSGRSIFC